MKRVSRRRFVQAGAAAIAAPYIIPGRVLGQDSPSHKITVGFIGVGDHGRSGTASRPSATSAPSR